MPIGADTIHLDAKRVKIESYPAVETDDSDDEDDHVQPYKVTADEFPRHGVYCSRFSEALDNAPEPIRMLLNEINGASDKPEDIRELCHFLGRTTNVNVPDAKIIGVLGESGVGR